MTESRTTECLFCGEEIKAIAKKCKHCGEFQDQSERPSMAPITQSVLTAEMKNKAQSDLNDACIGTGKLIGLSFVTGWIFFWIHLYKMVNTVSKQFNYAIGAKLKLTAIIFTGLSYTMYNLASSRLSMLSNHPTKYAVKYAVEESMLLSSIGGLLASIGGVLLIILAFKLKKALEEYAKVKLNYDFKLNPFATFFFTFIYINYAINKLKNS